MTERNPGLEFDGGMRISSKFLSKLSVSKRLELFSVLRRYRTSLAGPRVTELENFEIRVKQIVQKAEGITGCNRVAWLIKAVTCIDLTTLGGDDTPASVERLTKKAVKPLALPFEWSTPISTAAVCVYPARVYDVVKTLKSLEALGSVNIASVATGFPSGQYSLETRLAEIRYAVANGATEIDVVINRTLALTHKWKELYKEIKAMREASGDATMKTILATGELFDLKDVYRASIVAAFAGSDFIKTSTGKETVNATLAVGIVMCRAIRDYHQLTGIKIGFKPAGGIKTWKESLQWLVLIKEELGKEWLNNSLFRIGASSVLGDISNEIAKSLNELKDAETSAAKAEELMTQH